jgi:2-polyprenyl-3-methyl-5-hydroxy-6-metoxy-1,4-benzoquinol methylase
MPKPHEEAVERLDLTPESPWWGEHRSRYRFAAGWVEGAHVLDIACGTGFGGPILLDEGASQVTGVDIEVAPLLTAKASGREGQVLVQADGAALPFEAETFDVVVSFETLEHVAEAVGLVDELRRVLRPHGKLVLSTPNALHSRPVDGVPRNPFHVREYLPSELLELLSQAFGGVSLLGQRTHPRFPVSPFWELPAHLPRDLVGRSRVLSWKLQNRLPFRFKDSLARRLHGRGFFPGEFDFVFKADDIEKAHVLVAVCAP